MTSASDRRNFLKTAVAAAASGAVAQRAVLASGAEQTMPRQESENVIYHYEEPFDYGVMQGIDIGDDRFVGKNHDLPTSFFADQKRMRWALHHMSVLQPTIPIARSDEVMQFDYRPIDLDDVRINTGKGKSIGVQDWLTTCETDAFIAVYLSQDAGPLVATEQYFNGMKTYSLHHLWSMSKSLSVGVVAAALEQGKVQRKDTIGELLPELTESGLSDATLDDVLNMASGAKWYVGSEWSFENMVEFVMSRAFVAGGLFDSNKADEGLRKLGWMRFLKAIEKDRAHGEAFEYKDVDSRAAIAAAEKAFGRPFEQLFRELIWSKIGAEHDSFVCCDRYGCAATPYGFSASLRDCARWGLCHLPSSPRQILPVGFVNGLVSAHPTYESKSSRLLGTETGYRDQYWVYPGGRGGGFYAGGWMGQRIYIFPSLNVVIVQLASLWPDDYRDRVQEGPAFLRLAEHVATAYQKRGL